MRSFQFWVLVLGSLLVSALMLQEVRLIRSLNQVQSMLVDSQQLAASAPEYQNAWQTLAKNIYLASHQDPNHPDMVLMAVLKDTDVAITTQPPGPPAPGKTSTTTPAPATEPAPSVPPKAPVSP
jgi:hypothetical protein